MQINAPGDPNTVVAALKNAAAATGSDFSYLLGTAMRESSLKPNAQSNTSSAGGLFQFLDQTWFGLVKTHGAKYGLGSLAQVISATPDGRYHADNDADRGMILSLKKDPQISALMAGEYARSAQGAMEADLGRQVCNGELYAAHFLGADGACKLIRASQASPAASAAQLFPDAANANRDVFFNANGGAKSVREVYDWTMRQPGGSERPAVNATGAMTVAAKAVDSNIETLLASVINWQPGSFFQGDKTSLSLGSGLLDLLSGSRNGET
jgi:Transglycosylase SLT domain